MVSADVATWFHQSDRERVARIALSSQGVVLRYSGLTAVDARGRKLTSRMEVRGHEIRLIVEDRDARYPLIVDPIWTQRQESTASDGAAGDSFGLAVSVSGETAAIGPVARTIPRGPYTFLWL